MGKKKKSKDKVKELQQELKESASKIWLAGLGALAAAEEEGSKAFKTLVDKGKAYESRGREAIGDVKGEVDKAVDKARGQATTTADKIEEQLDDVVARALRRFGVPNRDEIATLTKRVEELTRTVESLKQTKAPAKKPAARKPAARKSASKSTASKSGSKSTGSKSTAKSTTSDS